MHGMLPRSFLLSVAVWAAFAGFLRIAVIPPESCGKTDAASLDAAAREATDWIIRNQLADGAYTYVYYPETDEVPSDYNMVRHAGVTMSLYQSAAHYQDEATLAAADAGLGWMIERLDSRHGWSAPFLPGEDARLGTAALMTVSLAERRLATGDTRYDDLLREIGRFMVSLQREDGNFAVGYDLSADAPIDGTSRYYPGEALWALALLHEAFPGEGWDDAAWLDLDYLVTSRDVLEDIPFPPLPDQWLAYGLAEMAPWGLRENHIAHARRMAGRFGLLVRTESQRQGSDIGSLLRGRDARAAGIGTWVEALGSLWRLANTDERFANLEKTVKSRLVCSAGILAERQVDAQEAAEFPRPGLMQGVWYTRGETRMDDQQHALSGLLYTLDALNGDAQRAPETPVFAAP
jgi:hypothetical protein